MLGIAEMFAELDGTQRMWDALEIWGAWRTQQQREHDSDPWRRKLKAIRARKWQKANPDERRVHQARFRAKPTERQKAVDRMREWRRKNPAKARAQFQRWKDRNPDKYRAKNQRARVLYRERHPDKVRERNRRNQAARRARLKAQKAAV